MRYILTMYPHDPRTSDPVEEIEHEGLTALGDLCEEFQRWLVGVDAGERYVIKLEVHE